MPLFLAGTINRTPRQLDTFQSYKMMSFFSRSKKGQKTPVETSSERQKPLTPLNSSYFDPANCIVTPLPDHVTSWISKGQFAIVIDNVLTEKECQQWIADTETGSYELALVNIGAGRQKAMTDVRNSSRIIIDDEMRAAELWERVKYFVPTDVRIGERLVPKELNERLRFLRYDPGEYFKPHCDGSYSHPVGHSKYMDVSRITLQLYLNEGFVGGETRFFGDWNHKKQVYDVVPKTGSVLLFEHQLYHSGETVVRGRKYAMRTDIMFTPLQQKPEPQENEHLEADVLAQEED